MKGAVVTEQRSGHRPTASTLTWSEPLQALEVVLGLWPLRKSVFLAVHAGPSRVANEACRLAPRALPDG